MRKRIAAVCLIAAAVALAPGPGLGQPWLSTPGAVGTQIAEVGRASLRLPPGDWQEVSQWGGGGGRFLSTREKGFVQAENGKLAAIMLIRASDEPISGHRARWVVPGLCWASPPEVLFANNHGLVAGSTGYNCLTVYFARIDETPGDPFTDALNARVAALGGYPIMMATARFQQTSRSGFDVISVRVFFNPLSPSMDAAVAKLRGAGSEPVEAIGKVVTAWAEAYDPTVAAALD